jgi:hypothetical protein
LSKLLVAVEGNCKVVLQGTKQCVEDFPLPQKQVVVPNIYCADQGTSDVLDQRAFEEVAMPKRIKAKLMPKMMVGERLRHKWLAQDFKNILQEVLIPNLEVLSYPNF